MTAAAAVAPPEPPSARHLDPVVGELEDLGSDDFVELYRHHYPRLVRSLTLAGASPQQAEDLAQEAFARVLGRWRRLRGGPHVAG